MSTCPSCGGPYDHSEAACQGDYEGNWGDDRVTIRHFFNKLFDWYPEDEIPEEEDFWKPGGWIDNRSYWEQYDEMPWNG